ncbi:serine/threonine protein phosphatase [Streptomyces sp. NPDC048436]|uniref:serine/threonine protein phosphatase n=1 Tax=Streptomyces sp. NPDC048436 TaxID=3365550 RepID=UPI00371BE460
MTAHHSPAGEHVDALVGGAEQQPAQYREAAPARRASPAPADPPAPPAPPAMVWVRDVVGELQAVGVWTERVSGRGEDAEPFIAHHLETQQGLIAVFDGSGGAGSAPVRQTPDGGTQTGAWVGSRVARLATDCWFHDVVTRDELDTGELLRDYMDHFHKAIPLRRSKIVGRMRRQLPTTLAAIRYHVNADKTLEAKALWAGDSRAYLLLPDSGLHVVTRDHTEETDALALLRSDPPMTNSICADREFTIDTEPMTLPLPAVLLAATDGFFGYVHTPAEFEYNLLHTLTRAQNADDWARLIRDNVQSYTADDASLALVALGYPDFSHLQSAFRRRHADMKQLMGNGRPQKTDQASQIRAWQDATWRDYRAGYETYLPPLPEERT